MADKPSKNQTYMEVAVAVSQRSPDTQTKVGAVLVKKDTGSIMATAYNGFVRGAPDDKLPTTRPDKYAYMRHAETNLIAQCARYGISMDNCKVICTHSPCSDCMRALWQSGITEVTVKVKYKDFHKLLSMRDLSVEAEEDSDGFISLTYRVED